MNKPLLIFDADGTLRRTITDPSRPPFADNEWELIPGVAKLMATVNWRQIRFGIASNQASVGRGLVSAELAYKMLWDLAMSVTGLVHAEPAIRMCPHLPSDDCPCRKPKPQMIQEIMGFFGTPPEMTTFIGDAESDKQAALAAGVSFVFARDCFRRS